MVCRFLQHIAIAAWVQGGKEDTGRPGLQEAVEAALLGECLYVNKTTSARLSFPCVMLLVSAEELREALDPAKISSSGSARWGGLERGIIAAGGHDSAGGRGWRGLLAASALTGQGATRADC